MVKIGGEGIKVQFSETAICNGELISNPSSTPDNKPNVQWLMGDIEGNCKNFVLKLVPKRKVPTILDVIEEHVVPGSIIVTDGYPSYPRAVVKFGSCHELVNHSNGFVNAQEAHTNQIEKLWSQHF